MRAGISLGRPFGVPLWLAPSWFLFAAVIVWFFAPVVQYRVPGPASYVVAFGYAVLLLVSVLLHEVAHALAARWSGMRVTGIVLNVWGGFTSHEGRTGPGRSLLIAVVGPVVNAVIALVAWRVGLVVRAEPDGGGVVGLLLGALTLSNALLAVFNLLPGLPLDGGHALEAVVWKVRGDRLAGTVAAGWVGRVLAVLVFVAGLLVPRLLGWGQSLTDIVWAGLVGALLWQGASEALKFATVARRVPALSARALQRPAIGVNARATVEEVVRSARAAIDAGATAASQRDLEVVLVTDDGVPVAVVDTAALRQVPAERRTSLGAGATARALPPRSWLPEDLAGEDLLQAVQVRPGEHVVVDTAGRVRGLLHTGDVIAAVTAR
ncbi:site-2 protease family protein [Kineococcus rhizosphaerae]|uniref:Zinc metalloprotease n=1 Tax=Kineococcus rhizosphaerae TaxID=559628 RepID=A0A2T0RA91_9ACTN|nr:site-2 protease family protein [Kineococcus rhizosphaerae]PRY18086.1 Zn-dependent protease [Kineococcus rhizosphaerae]